VTVLHARLLADGTPAADLRCHAYLYAAHLLRGIDGFGPTGLLQRPAPATAPGRLPAIAERYAASGPWLRLLDRAEAAALADWPVEDGCLFLPGAGRVDIPRLVAGLLSHPGIEVVPEPLPHELADACRVLACGAAMHAFEPARYLELAPVAGQIDLVTLPRAPALPLVGRGYLVPAGARMPGGDVVAAGASYEYRPWPPERATAANLAQLEGHDHVWRSRCRGTRTVSSDRVAVAGPLYDAGQQPLRGLYASAGHGSSGNVSTHFAAAVLTALIGGDCPPLERSAQAALSPLRFRQRQARRGQRHGATA
jgi:tRNA 5-methylaminomethyl-2-thiouridine biosynthesis bifunctional protein